uniref:Myristylated protein n=1 Tax=Heterorhabditis bacteriophora TaxID=37862 RepID=A0A1I7XM22_HETBA
MQSIPAIAREANYCLQKKISGFPGVPDIPDLEEGSFQFKDSVISTLSDHILIHSRLAFCGERKPARASNTNKCLHNPFVGYLSEHCKVLSSCDSRIAIGTCAKTIPSTRQATCECINDARDDLKNRIASISNVFSDLLSGDRGIAIGSSNKVDICVANIKKQMITPVNDWVTVIDSALSTCIKKKPAGQNLGMEAMLNVGCRKVIADTTGAASQQLKTGFDFVNNLIDAMVERSGRFCGGSHCLQG